jgi:hypothetical protein
MSYDHIGKDEIRERIIHTLSVYPKLNPTMLGMGIGPYIPSRLWNPVLEELIKADVVSREFINIESVGHRNKLYTILSLTPAKFVEDGSTDVTGTQILPSSF